MAQMQGGTLQPAAPRLHRLSEQQLLDLAEQIKKLGVTVKVSP